MDLDISVRQNTGNTSVSDETWDGVLKFRVVVE